MVKKIIGSENCTKCKQAKKNFPDAEYIDINIVSRDEKDILIQKAVDNNLTGLPIVFDEFENVISHKELGI
jgi:arsenate reductase-like glutaredoxin family protein